jgi:predicted nucleic acid-binding protein
LYQHNVSFSILPDVVAEFFAIGQLEVLNGLSSAFFISDYAQAQLRESEIDLKGAELIVLDGDADLAAFDEIRRMNRGLAIADVGALAIATKTNTVVLTNDSLVRYVANAMQLCTWGTLRILEYAVAVGLILAFHAVAIVEKLAIFSSWLSSELRKVFKERIHKAAHFAMSESYSLLPSAY